MSRSGYTDDCDNWALIKWRGAVASAIRGRRGQVFLREALAVLDALPAKRLIHGELWEAGEVCALGAVGIYRNRWAAAPDIDPYDRATVAGTFGITSALAAEVMYENDEGGGYKETPERRWERMRAWIVSKIFPPGPAD